MIKLETKTQALPQIVARLVIESATAVPAVALSCEGIREQVNGDWVDSAANVRQTVAGYLHGKPFSLSGKVAQAYAVEIGSCFKAVLNVELKTALTTAFEKGDRSREICQVQLLNVVEVWESPTKCLWRASDGGAGAGAQGSKELDAGGRIVAAQPAGRS